ncbi:C69 family dipeptidase [Ligilactobacillus sp. WILCCON 0076]|uniref:Dipeptidase n=1 Tax=Ligilactobacillus ubinensis TaxID=2876789 RepID=A0A9X2FI62_9LACO|nr:C69 family dipeptidase [Ligilactobacillus ubinensis]MCP0886397.1 C69 family dipeptidase [Ligilactobacillus ubinensis]
MNIVKQRLSACTSILVGKKATLDGSTFIGRNEDFKSAWPKHMCVHSHKEFKATQSFVSKSNGFKISLPSIRYKYTATPEWTDEFGLLEENGINEYGVAMSATESAYANSNVLSYDPLVKDGISEEAMLTVVLPYVSTAKAGVKRLGEIVTKHGASEANGILFADNNEVWYMEIGSGHHWVAQRIPDDCYAVVANQLSIQKIDFNDSANFLASPNIQQFVQKNHLNPALESNFIFRDIFGTHTLFDEIYNTPRVWYGQKFLTPSKEQVPMDENLAFTLKPDRKLGIDDLTYVLSSHFQKTPYDPIGQGDATLKHKFRPISLAKTQESHVLQLRPNLPPALSGIQWLALGVPAQSIFVPFYAGASDVHSAYKLGNETYSPDSAYWTYKHVGILVDAHYPLFGPILKDLQDELTTKFKQHIHLIDQKAIQNSFSGKELEEYLTKNSIELQELGLTEFKKLAAQLITSATDLSPLNFKTDANL